MTWRASKGIGCLAALILVVGALTASACASPDGSGAAKTTQTVAVTTTATATPGPATTTDDSQVALRQILSAISTGKAQLAQYEHDLNATCGSGVDSKECRTAIRYSATVGTQVMANVGRFAPPPAEVTDLWNSTVGTALALSTMNDTWCAPGRDFIACYSHVLGTAQRLTQQFAGWDPYLPPQ